MAIDKAYNIGKTASYQIDNRDNIKETPSRAGTVKLAAQQPVASQSVHLNLEKIDQPAITSRSLYSVMTLLEIRYKIAALTLEKLNLSNNSDIDAINQKASARQVMKLKADRMATKQEVAMCQKIDHDLITLIAAELIKKGMPASKAYAQAKQAYKQNMVQYLNDQPWKTISTEFCCHGQDYQCISTPAGQMKLGQSERDIFQVSYENKGVSSASKRETNHAANLWSSTLYAKNDKGEDQLLFQGIRHAVLSPIEIQDPQEKIEGAINRARELATAALYLQPDKLNDALAGKPVTLCLTSTSLLTPGLGGEGGMLQDQVTALRAISQPNQPVSLVIYDAQGEKREVSVQLQVVPFNIPVNELALKLGAGHKDSDKLNQPSLSILLGDNMKEGAPIGGWVGEYLAGTPNNRQQVIEMTKHIRQIWRLKKHHHDGGDPYKLAKLIPALSYAIGIIPAYNCKSGKDRTGVEDVELKTMLVNLHQGQRLNPPGLLNSHNQATLQTLLLNSGSLEIQEYNTGCKGSKVMQALPVPSLNLSYQKRIGNKEVWLAAQGLSPYYSS